MARGTLQTKCKEKMIRLLILSLIFILPLVYYIIFRLVRACRPHQHIKLFSYVCLKMFALFLLVSFVLYVLIMAYRLETKAGQEGKRTIYTGGKLQ